MVNLLNPHPWIFWAAVGAPILAGTGLGGSLLFLAPFYVLLIGAKVIVAAVLAAGRERLLRGRGSAWALRASGLLLLAAGVLLAVEGINSL